MKRKKILCVFLSVMCFTSICLATVAKQTEKAKKVWPSYGVQSYEADDGISGDQKLTRAQFAHMLWDAFGVEVHGDSQRFSDLDSSHWAYDSINKAVCAGWLSGYDNGKFGTEDNITYEQVITVICRITGIKNYGQYPQSYVAACIDKGISDGVDGRIGADITLGQAAMLIQKAEEYMKENGTTPYVFNYKSSYDDMKMYEKYSNSTGRSGGGGGGRSAYAYFTADSVASPYMGGTTPGPDHVNTEEYSTNDENVFKDALTSPLSTFSIDTDTASYSNMRRFILNGQEIRTGAIRTEELINYFDFKGPDVSKGEVFGVKTEVGVCPWNEANKLAMITVKGEEHTGYKPSNLVFLIDTSGSMYSENKLPYVKKALSMLLDKLGENDTISVVTYASGTGVALEPTPATEKDKILRVIDGLDAGGSTAGASGINLAYNLAEKARIDGNNRIILCTDGDFNVGIHSVSDLEKFIEEKRNTGIYLSVLGFGMGNYKDNVMETLADKGNGNYAYIDNLKEAKKVLVDDMAKTIYAIAKDVKIQVEFNPSYVKSYRLVGYENRLLNNEDFANDQKDAGELGAGANVTVFYEIVPSDGTEKTQLKYQDVIPKASDELMTVKIRYKPINSDKSILKEISVANHTEETVSGDFCFAAAVAEVGMILNNSEYKGTATLDSAIDLASKGTKEDKFGLRTEFIQLVDLLGYINK